MATPRTQYVAQAAHEINRVWCLVIGDQTQDHWEHVPDWLRDSIYSGVDGVRAGKGPRESHEAWSEYKRREGWVHGPVKDESKKTHPNLVPYDDLPVEQRLKDHIFHRTVKLLEQCFDEVNATGTLKKFGV
jgi:hypothetical protein